MRRHEFEVNDAAPKLPFVELCRWEAPTKQCAGWRWVCRTTGSPSAPLTGQPGAGAPISISTTLTTNALSALLLWRIDYQAENRVSMGSCAVSPRSEHARVLRLQRACRCRCFTHDLMLYKCVRWSVPGHLS